MQPLSVSPDAHNPVTLQGGVIKEAAERLQCGSGTGVPHISSVTSQVEYVTQDQGGAAEPLETGSYHWLVKSQLSAVIIPLQMMRHSTEYCISPTAEALLGGRAGMGDKEPVFFQNDINMSV